MVRKMAGRYSVAMAAQERAQSDPDLAWLDQQWRRYQAFAPLAGPLEDWVLVFERSGRKPYHWTPSEKMLYFSEQYLKASTPEECLRALEKAIAGIALWGSRNARRDKQEFLTHLAEDRDEIGIDLNPQRRSPGHVDSEALSLPAFEIDSILEEAEDQVELEATGVASAGRTSTLRTKGDRK